MADVAEKDRPADSLADEKFTEQNSTKSDDEKQQQLESNAQSTDEPEKPPRDITGWKWYSTVIAMLFTNFLYALDATVVADLQPVIVKQFGGIQKLPWLSVAFLLCATATNLVWGRIYSQFNVKWFYIFNIFLFEVGSAICGAAPSMNVEIVGRALAGAAGSGMYVGCMTLLAMITTIKERPLYISCTGFTWGAGIVLGPVIGGAFSESAVGWRWAFYINLFIGAVCAPFYIFLIPNKDPRPGATFRERAAEMDYVGIILQAGILTAFLMAINWGGITYPWGDGRIIALFVVAAVLLIIFAIQQTWNILTTVSRRIIPVQFFKSKTVLILFAATAADGACAFVPIYMVPLFFQFTRGDGPLDAGVRLLPFIVVMVVFNFLNGGLMGKLGYYMPWYLVGSVLVVIGGALMFTVDQSTSDSKVYGFTVLLGAGVGMYLQASFSVAQAVVDMENLAPAIGFITVAQFLGISIALAIANTVLLNRSQDKILELLPNVPLKSVQAAILGANSDLVKSLPAQVKSGVIAAIANAVSQTYILVIAGGALVVVLSVFLPRTKQFVGSA